MGSEKVIAERVEHDDVDLETQSREGIELLVGGVAGEPGGQSVDRSGEVAGVDPVVLLHVLEGGPQHGVLARCVGCDLLVDHDDHRVDLALLERQVHVEGGPELVEQGLAQRPVAAAGELVEQLLHAPVILLQHFQHVSHRDSVPPPRRAQTPGASLVSAWRHPGPTVYGDRRAPEESTAMPPLPVLPTSLVGSYAQPEWLIDRAKLAGRFPPRVRAAELWRVGPEYLAEAQDDATILAIRAQERAGLDVITDGEIRRESYSNRFATALEGVDLDNPGTALDRSGHPNPVPRIVGKIRRKHSGRGGRPRVPPVADRPGRSR